MRRKNIGEFLKGVRTAAVAGHVNPDGDCVGSCLGVYNYIRDNYPETDVDVYLEYINLSGKAIRSVTFTGYFNNQEGKAIANEISPHNKSVTCRDFNAVKAYGKSMKTCSDLSYYNKNVKSFVITAVRVQYKDGSSASMNTAKCQALMDKNRNFTPEERRFFKERWL